MANSKFYCNKCVPLVQYKDVHDHSRIYSNGLAYSNLYTVSSFQKRGSHGHDRMVVRLQLKL
jgi:hypothetical protein